MSLRRRLTATLFGGAALGSTGYIAAFTVSGLVVMELTGSAVLAGLPGALGTAGTAAGATLFTLGVASRGRRPGLVTGYALGSLGAVTAVLGVVWGSALLVIVAMAMVGLGNASNQLARYTGAEMFEPSRRGTAISVIVWAGTIGSVLGPILLEPGGALTSGWGFSELAGGYVVAIAFMAIASLLYTVALRPDPTTLDFDGPPVRDKAPFGDAFSRPQVRTALAAMIAGQVVMVLIMTATPLHIRHHGFDLGAVGVVMSAHTLGMYALSPLVGRITDRVGPSRSVIVGMTLLAASAILSAVAPTDSTALLLFALFLLGLGWNFGFVAGSALLTVGFSPGLRVRLQGRADSITWVSSAIAAILSGIVFELTDYRFLSLAGLCLLVVPALVVLRNRAKPATAPVS